MPVPFDSLCAKLQARADILVQMGAEGPARAIKWCIGRLEKTVQERELEALTLDQAAAESSALEKMVRRGELENVGRKGSPRVRRGGLPRKAHRVPPSAGSMPDLMGRILGYDPGLADPARVARSSKSSQTP